ncbi:hypothetical protein EVAR_66331_1 [Eumeta japonica]|uniref:Uncharacterized protein n=1 Tax=Eumeta variegata TaxID=151549 RepID=A0A4C1Z5A7_EUMVA|nr:hypothetical protein EVAR_66331_1 [Eumeta japonica]
MKLATKASQWPEIGTQGRGSRVGECYTCALHHLQIIQSGSTVNRLQIDPKELEREIHIRTVLFYFRNCSGVVLESNLDVEDEPRSGRLIMDKVDVILEKLDKSTS